MAVEQGTTPPAKTAGTKEGTPSPTQTLEDVLKATQAIQTQQASLAKELAWQRSVQDKRDREYREMLAGQRPTADPDADAGYLDPDAEAQARKVLNSVLAERDERILELRDSVDLAQFKLDNSDWKEMWAEMQEVTSDPTVSHLVDIKRKDGSRDYYRSLSNAKLQAEVRRLRAAQAEAQAAKAAEAEEKRNREAQALTSGGYATSEEEGPSDIDLSDPNLKSDDILKKFPGLVDRKDPPKPVSEV